MADIYHEKLQQKIHII